MSDRDRTYLGTRDDAGWTRCARSDCQREHAEHHEGCDAMLCPVTPQTLTDEMIRELMYQAVPADDYRLVGLCDDALEGYQGARERVAEEINARRAKEQP